MTIEHKVVRFSREGGDEEMDARIVKTLDSLAAENWKVHTFETVANTAGEFLALLVRSA